MNKPNDNQNGKMRGVMPAGSWSESGDAVGAGEIIEHGWPSPAVPAYQECYEDAPGSELWQAAVLFRQKFGDQSRVLYPSCGGHKIDKLFTGSSIVYVDPDSNIMRLISGEIGSKSKAVVSGIEEFQAEEPFDLVFLLNTYGDKNSKLKDLKQGGYVFCNNYFGTRDAEDVMRMGNCELVAVINREPRDGELVMAIETFGLESYTSPVESDDEMFGPLREKSADYYVFKKK